MPDSIQAGDDAEREAKERARHDRYPRPHNPSQIDQLDVGRWDAFDDGWNAHREWAAARASTGDDRLREALEYLADPESWGGNPLSQEASLYGHDTPFELARAALAVPSPATDRKDRDR